jgi:APA family basic amino acid/polyamine antiporter
MRPGGYRFREPWYRARTLMPGQTTQAREPAAASPEGLVRAIGLPAATLLVIGNVIGSAIFLTSGTMAAELQSTTALLGAWLAGGLLTMAGGLTFAEMGAMLPRTGGLYVFLKEAYGPVWGFLFGWAALLVVLTGSVAGVAVGFAEYLSYFLPAVSTSRVVIDVGPITVTAGGIVAAVSILAIGWLNLVGVAAASRVQAVLTVAKVLGIAAIPVLALALMPATPSWAPVVPPVARPAAAFGIAMIAVMWAFEGWSYLAMSAGEIRDAGRVVPKAYVLGTVALTAIYLAVNAGYVFTLSLGDMAGETRVAEKAMTVLMGPRGAAFIAAVVVVSTLGCNVAGTLAMSRACFAMARAGLFFRSVAAIHPAYRTPHVAIAVTCVWSAVLAISGTYEQLFTYVTFASVLFSMFGGLAIFRLRRTHAHLPRPYRVWGYPIVPAVFVAGSGLLVVNTLMERPVESLLGLGLVALGLPAYWHWRSGASVEVTE